MGIQQKACKNAKAKAGLIQQRIERKHLRYYATKEKLPVFLLVVDNTTREGYYLFLQKWLDENTTPAQLKHGPPLAISVPEENKLSRSDAFVDAFSSAIAYMAAKYPGSVEDAMREDIKSLAVEAGWDVKLNVVDGKKHYQVTPKGTKNLQLKIGDTHAKKFLDTIAYGTPIEITGDDIEILGLPVPEQFKGKGPAKLSIKPNTTSRAEFHFWTEAPDEFRLTLAGEMTTGKEGVRFACWLENAPLKVEVKVSKNVIEQRTGQAALNISWDYAKWVGMPVINLAYFEPISEFCQLAIKRRTIKHQLNVNGNRVTRGHLGTATDLAPFENAISIMESLSKMRTVARIAAPKLSLPNLDSLMITDIAAIDEIHSLLTTGEYSQSAAHLSIDATIELKGEDRLEALRLFEQSTSGLTWTESDVIKTLFGMPIKVGDITHDFGPGKANVTDAEKANFLSRKSDSLKCELTPLEGTRLVTKRALSTTQ